MKWDLKWDCGICKQPAKDTVALFEQYLSAVRRVQIFRDSDGVKWVNCSHCDTWYHWPCVISMSDQDSDLFSHFCANRTTVENNLLI